MACGPVGGFQTVPREKKRWLQENMQLVRTDVLAQEICKVFFWIFRVCGLVDWM
jgi:hypothetical protein